MNIQNLKNTVVIAIGFAALIANTPAVAQTLHTATIPFAFEAGGHEYPGGTYEIRRVGSNPVLRLTNRETLRSNMVLAPIAAANVAAVSPKLMFQATENGYRLSEVWLQDTPGMKLMTPKANREAASVKVDIK